MIADLRKHGYDPTRVVLFGSVAKGKTHAHSDIDLAIWAAKFTGCRLVDIESVVQIPHRYARVEVHPFSLDDTSEDNPFIKEIEKKESKFYRSIRMRR